jgi:hypothetical protein
MQRKGSGWITGTPTPSAVNSTVDTDSGNTDPETPSVVNENEDDPINKDIDIKTLIKPDPKYSSNMIIPDVIIQETPVTFESTVKRDGFWNDLIGRFEWSLGDGGSLTFPKSTEFNYIYHEPGTYVVMLHYYSDVFRAKPDAIHKKTITVIPASVGVSINHSTGTVTLSNQSTDELNIGNWKLQNTSESFMFPQDTIIPKSGSITIPPQVHTLMNWSRTPSLFTSTGYEASLQKNAQRAFAGSQIIQTPVQIEPVEKKLFEAANTKNAITPAVKGNYKNLIWIALFIILLVLANIAFILLGKKIEESEPVVNRV